ncbi:hypothetical protein RHMOL_Rhmol04G0192600 [Rhododendron molle]|uniref:Uncharacterized protein n=1 Tax=Rhododendron molle TaxID=49168 RepID=A0ACC0P2J2_RHOML|nr:hypothetical protein RHMOL_Rhmol04G0192600 [Rhododendron molle]
MLVTTPVLTLLVRNSRAPIFFIPIIGTVASWSRTLFCLLIFGILRRWSTFKLEQKFGLSIALWSMVVFRMFLSLPIWSLLQRLRQSKDLADDLGLDMEVPKATTVSDKGKCKLWEVPSGFWDVNEDPQVVPSLGNVHNITRSGRIFQPANLQAGSLSNPSNQRNEPFAFPKSALLEVPASLPNADLVQRQLERIPAAMSIWGLICSSREHRQKLCHTLSRLEV